MNLRCGHLTDRSFVKGHNGLCRKCHSNFSFLLDIEEKFKKRLESEQTKSAYETTLEILKVEIDQLEHQKSSLSINPNFKIDFEKLNTIKYYFALNGIVQHCNSY